MLEKRPWVPAVVYIVGAIFLGPAIYLAGYVITPANGDRCNPEPHGSAEQRDRDYALVDGIQHTGSLIMLAAGVLLLILLWTKRRRLGPVSLVSITAGMLVMMAGYLMVFHAGSGVRC
ncbi:hypothetical protein [Nocardia carnea]|uniref:hypothetical protein n=1 Tax=Nocardia carnea TaxID=37328 RepID=UPI002455FDAF|nr:hypothetical protein [Nocardia carnea]